MNHDQFSLRLAAYYKEPIQEIVVDKSGEEMKVANIRIQENHKFILENVHASSLNDFFKRIIQHFKPTSTVPYPLVCDLLVALNSGYIHEPYHNDEKLDWNKTLECYSQNNNVPNSCPEDVSNHTVSQVLDILSKLTNEETVRKFGVESALKMWSLDRYRNEGLPLDSDQLFSEWFDPTIIRNKPGVLPAKTAT